MSEDDKLLIAELNAICTSYGSPIIIARVAALRIADLAEALEIAANRLARCAIDPEWGTEQSYEWQEWATEARQALKGPDHDPAQIEGQEA